MVCNPRCRSPTALLITFKRSIYTYLYIYTLVLCTTEILSAFLGRYSSSSSFIYFLFSACDTNSRYIWRVCIRSGSAIPSSSKLPVAAYKFHRLAGLFIFKSGMFLLNVFSLTQRLSSVRKNV